MDDRIIRQGRRRLKSLLPAARARARSQESAMKAGNGVAAAMIPYITEANLDALVIYPAPSGGWHADIILKRVPPGVGNTLGSPVGSPLETRDLAETFGLDLLVMVLDAARNHGSNSDDGAPTFILYDTEFRLSSATYEVILKEMPEATAGYGSHDVACGRITEILAELMPDGFSHDSFKRLGRDDKIRIYSVLHIAALSHVLRYPPRPDATPFGHASDESRH